MDNPFFDAPILNSPYERPSRHWELDDDGQPTHQTLETRRPAAFITPIPKPRKRKGKADQKDIIFEDAKGLSDENQQYELTALINDLRMEVEQWRNLPNPSDWLVTPQTARLLQHWRHHPFNDIRPFFCQVEAVETAIWLTEVAPQRGKIGKRFLEHLANANAEANPDLNRVALKLATGAGKTTVMAVKGRVKVDQHGAVELDQFGGGSWTGNSGGLRSERRLSFEFLWGGWNGV